MSTYCMQSTAGRPSVHQDPVPALGGSGTRKKTEAGRGEAATRLAVMTVILSKLSFSAETQEGISEVVASEGSGLLGVAASQCPSWGQRLSPIPRSLWRKAGSTSKRLPRVQGTEDTNPDTQWTAGLALPPEAGLSSMHGGVEGSERARE